MQAICFRGSCGRRSLGSSRDLLDGLANDLQLANDGVLTHPLGHERLAPPDVYRSTSLMASRM
jgi:hypothetical protein